jgi:hypothetical protein
MVSVMMTAWRVGDWGVENNNTTNAGGKGHRLYNLPFDIFI